MKVLLITTPYVIGHRNGLYYHDSLRDHINRYKQLGDITLCCSEKADSKFNTVLDMSDFTYRPIKLTNTVKGVLQNTGHNKSIIKDEISKADLIIAYMPSDLGCYACKEAHKQGKKVLLVAISCPWDSLWNHSWKGKILAPISWLRNKKAFSKADYALYVTSEFLQRRYPTKGLNAGISDVVLNTIDQEQIWESRLNKIQQLDFNESEEIKLVTCAAVNVKYKRQKDVITAIHTLKTQYNLHYHLVGGGNQTFLKQYAKKLGVEDRIHFHGLVSHVHIFKLLEDMDIYIQPSKQEGLSRALLEAMSLGLPCIASTTGGNPELLISEYLFQRGSAKSLVDTLKTNLNKVSLLKCSEYCISRSKDYSSRILDCRRSKFFNQILQDIHAKDV